MLVLGDYLGPQEVGEGENCVHFTKGGGGEGDITAAKGGKEACRLSY